MAARGRHTEFPAETHHYPVYHWSFPRHTSATHTLHLGTCNKWINGRRPAVKTWCKHMCFLKSEVFCEIARKRYDIVQHQQNQLTTSAFFLLSRTHLKRFVSSPPAGGSVVIRWTSSCMQLSWQRNRRSLQINRHQDNKLQQQKNKLVQARRCSGGFRATKTQRKNRPPVLGLALL